MKKAIALILAMALCMAMFAGCTPKESAPSGTDNPTQTPDDSKQPPASDPNEDDYLLRQATSSRACGATTAEVSAARCLTACCNAPRRETPPLTVWPSPTRCRTMA